VAYPLTHQLGGPARHHAAIAGADQYDILQVLVEHQLRHFVGLRFGCDTRTHLAFALAATVEARRVDLMPRGAQQVRYRLPDPTALIGAVHQHVCRHGLSSASLVESPTLSSASADGAVGQARYRARFPRSTGCRLVFVADGRRLRRALSSDIESPAAKADRTQI